MGGGRVQVKLYPNEKRGGRISLSLAEVCVCGGGGGAVKVLG